MARHANRIPLYTHNGTEIRRVTFEVAQKLIDQGTVTKVVDTHWKMTGVKMKNIERNEQHSAGSITAKESETAAFVHVGARLKATRSGFPIDAMRTFDSALAKIAAWPEIYDDRAPVICAGKSYGTIFAHLPIAQLVSFA